LKDDARVCESPKPGKQDRSLDVVSGNESKRVHTEVPHALDALLLTRLCKPLPKDAPSSKPVLRLGTNALKFVRQCLPRAAVGVVHAASQQPNHYPQALS